MNRRILAATAAVARAARPGSCPAAVFARQPGPRRRPLPDAIKAMKLDKTVKRPDLKSRVHRDLRLGRGQPARAASASRPPPSSTLASQGRAAEVRAGPPDQRAAEGVHRGASSGSTRKVKVLGQTQRATNIVALQVDASQLEALAKDPNVVSIHPVVNYQKALSETVPYIGATAVQAKGFTGQGVRVGILDSGIDYTHVEFGGAGTAGAYEAAYGTSPDDTRNTTLDGLFPTSRVDGGFDFVGESWPGDDGIEDPDPDPIDFEGHGTHVADIIGGTHGVAPKAQLYALKVCSAVDTACSGVGLIRAMDWAVDPNGDGSTTDHLDVVNMSLGGDYGESFDDDLSLAVDTASWLGMLTVAAAGNGGDLPVHRRARRRTPRPPCRSRRPRCPSAVAFPLVVSARRAIAGAYPNTEVLDWSGVHDRLRRRRRPTSGMVARPTPSSHGSPEDPYLADPTGKVALIDRGACSVSLKVERAAQAGATAVIIGLVAPGDAVSVLLRRRHDVRAGDLHPADPERGDQGRPRRPTP